MKLGPLSSLVPLLAEILDSWERALPMRYVTEP
jgi:hypothetical protein